jgi:hypothetical protein
MRALLAPLALSALLAGPVLAQAPKFIKVDIIGKSVMHHHGNEDGPTEVHVRMPISMAKGILSMANDSDIKINGKTRKELKVDQLVKLLEDAKPGDLLLELTTDKGDLVKITVQ